MNLRNTKLLFIEDDQVDQMAFKRFFDLGKTELAYQLASSYQEAIELMEKEKFDIIISDYSLNMHTGSEVIAAAGDTPVIIVTGMGDEETAIKVMHEGAYDYVVKDSEYRYLKILPLAIKKVLGRKQSEEEIKKLSYVASKTDNAVIITNGEGKIEWVNEGFRRVTGYDLPDVAGTFGELFCEGESIIEKMIQLIQSGKEDRVTNRSFRKRNTSKQGREYWLNMTASPVFGKKNTLEHLIIVASDITDLKKTEEELIRAKKVAEEAKRNEELFLANTSHEIRTPMNGILGMADLLFKTKIDPEQREYLEAIKFSADNLLSIINDILDFSKINAGRIEFEKIDFSLDELLTSLMKSFKHRTDEKNLYFTVVREFDVPEFLKGDPYRLNQVLINLVGNAIKFTEKGGIKIKIRIANKEEEKVYLAFEVEDTGIGIPAEKLDTIFESFKQAHVDTSRKYGGTGLGLSITEKLVNAQNGSICVSSKAGKGSTFSFIIPFTEGEKVEKSIGKNGEEYSLPEKVKILIVEDNVINQKVASGLITKWHADYDIADNGKIALEKLKSHPGEYDMILMDIRMPEMDGIEATLKIRNEILSPESEIPIIAMTASAMESERVHCLEVGMTDFLIKPFSSENLFKIINSHLRKNRPMGPRSKSMPSENATAVKSESPLFDISCMDEIVQGDDAFREELISLFIRNIPKDLIKLKEAWERKDYSAVGAIAHKMTPSLEMMGVSSLKNIIIELKNSTFSEQNLESIPQWISIVDDMCCKVVRELKQTWHLPEKEDS